MRIRYQWSALLVVALLGCASGGGSTEAASQTTPTADPSTPAAANATIRIDNNRPSGSDVTVFIIPEAGGIRASLGSVQSNATGTFTYVATPGYYMLEASSGSGSNRSERFRLSNGQVATWNMSTNNVQVSTRR
ncbi:MAG: hypothetical protein ACREMA_05230 [Longimicrobiales bacterium]